MIKYSGRFFSIPGAHYSIIKVGNFMILYVQFGLYLVLMLVIGYISMKRTNNNEDFLIGGRKLGAGVTAISAGASDMSS